ncbi:MAG: peptidylprolyl isomerase, partial [Verrucomicrobiota bacterium]|nr:peptidylprolyl isomerase [Verrucomicrobiota bacterium]
MFNSNQKKRQRLINLPFFFVIFLLSIQLGLNANPSPPESIEAKAPWFGNLIIEWIDSSLDEESYALQYRTNPQSDWVTLSLLNASTKSSKLSGGSPGQEYEFRVLSIKGDKISSSPSSKTIMPDTFLNPPFAKINEGQLFEIELMANNLSKSETVTYSASPLPKGLSINTTTGKIRGIVEEDGFFDVIIRADYDSPESTPSISKLALRIPPQLSAPVLVNPIPDQSLTINQSNITLDLNNYINDPDTQKAIEIITNKGVMIFSLFEKATPAPVNNFLDYVENETYKNNVFHRSVTNDGMSIIQSGSFTLSETRLTSNLTKDPIINAPGIPNTKGTIAYARTSNPDSATSGWYINASDSPGLDSGDSYTVFGRATDGSISVIETIQEIP